MKTFPIQSERGAAAHPLEIPWSVAEKAYSVYSGRYGRSQSLECLAGRGGFAPSEMDLFHPGWREEASEVARLRAEVERLERERIEALEKAAGRERQLSKAWRKLEAAEARAARLAEFVEWAADQPCEYEEWTNHTCQEAGAPTCAYCRARALSGGGRDAEGT